MVKGLIAFNLRLSGRSINPADRSVGSLILKGFLCSWKLHPLILIDGGLQKVDVCVCVCDPQV